jgi:hypothetical protein
MKLVTSLPPTQRLLFVFKQTRFHPLWEQRVVGRPVGEFSLQDLSAVQKALVWKSYVQYFRANPRKILYMLKLAFDLVGHDAPNAEVDLLLDEQATAVLPEPLLAWPHKVYTCQDLNKIPPDVLSQLQARNHDCIILLYPDAIGLSWELVEAQMMTLSAPSMLVLNGRRRLFKWDTESQRVIGRRRLIEGGCLMEIVLLPALVLASIPLALYDMLNRLRRKGIASAGQDR